MTSEEGSTVMTSPTGSEVPGLPTITSSDIVLMKGRRFKQRPLGPAPFASFEDLSDELDSPPETARITLPGIKEDPSSQLQSPSTPQPSGQTTSINLTEREEQGLKDALKISLEATGPPRIDISRASSSSQHEDSITSSPERENGTQNLGYKEDGTVDLRSSTEELDYIQEPGTVEESEEKRKRERMLRRQQQVRNFGDTQSQLDFVERKDSSCSVMSDVGLLCISGRTSRLSSIGSAASGGSVASGGSHLSVGSHLSGRSTRSPSPHKMLLETSFCGSKPVHTQGGGELEASSAPASLTDQSTSRPSSRLRSRSPSPHKMLLETSFCGTKQIIAAESQKSAESSPKIPKSGKAKLSATPQPAAKVRTDREKAPTTVVRQPEPKKRLENVVDMVRPTTAVTTTTSSAASAAAAAKARAVGQSSRLAAEKKSGKPKKVISLRDLPVDEIYIPLKGPEVDFEEIIRKTSPNVKKKTVTDTRSGVVSSSSGGGGGGGGSGSSEKRREKEVPLAATSTATEIYIPLHSPPKGSPVDAANDGRRLSPPPPVVPLAKKERSPRKEPDAVTLSQTRVTRTERKPEKKLRQYEVCEDGSIFIPLHSPEDEKPAREPLTVEDVEEVELFAGGKHRSRRGADDDGDEDRQSTKPATLDLTVPTGGNTARLSQPLAPGKSEMNLGGSRTPSPGSSLSRKSSFAALFRKSDVFGSPDSQSGGSGLVRKKSGTLASALKDVSDGFRERSNSRGKSKERQQQQQQQQQAHSSLAHSPSGKKNVFANLFGKKKADVKTSDSGKDPEDLAPRLDLQFTFASEAGAGSRSAEEGDYIIIPLRDPSDPPASLDIVDDETGPVLYPKTERKDAEEGDRPSSPLVILERTESPKMAKSCRTTDEGDAHVKSERLAGEKDDERPQQQQQQQQLLQEQPEQAASDLLNEIEGKLSEIMAVKQIRAELRSEMFTTDETIKLDSSSIPSGETNFEIQQQQSIESVMTDRVESPVGKVFKSVVEGSSPAAAGVAAAAVEGASVAEDDTKASVTEVVTVSADGVRKLKLPPEPGDLDDDHERKGLVNQESFEDELPYVPTTLPLERSLGVPIVPVKQRMTEIKTCPIERPRSTTPINPTTLEDFVSSKDSAAASVSREEKMKISLPKEESASASKSKSPRRYSAKGKSWFEFAEAGLQNPKDCRKSSLRTSPSPPPLPPRSSPTPPPPPSSSSSVLSSSAPPTTASWINFEELPEKRKLPKRITTVPALRSSADGGAAGDKVGSCGTGGSGTGPIVYNYVSPEDCQCECHDHNSSSHGYAHGHDGDHSKKGTREMLLPDPDVNGDFVGKGSGTKPGSQGDCELSECKYCEGGDRRPRRRESTYHDDDDEMDIEETPLLEENSEDGDNDDSPGRRDRSEDRWTTATHGSAGIRMPEVGDRSTNDDSRGDSFVPGYLDVKPFSMDLSIESNRSSLTSQDDPASPTGSH